jgi:hypothetical protein
LRAKAQGLEEAAKQTDDLRSVVNKLLAAANAPGIA